MFFLFLFVCLRFESQLQPAYFTTFCACYSLISPKFVHAVCCVSPPRFKPDYLSFVYGLVISVMPVALFASLFKRYHSPFKEPSFALGKRFQIVQEKYSFVCLVDQGGGISQNMQSCHSKTMTHLDETILNWEFSHSMPWESDYVTADPKSWLYSLFIYLFFSPGIQTLCLHAATHIKVLHNAL